MLWKNGDVPHIYLVLSVAVAVICVSAIVVNANNFLDNAFSHATAIAEERDRLKAGAENGRASIRQIIRYIWREKRSTFYELAIAMVFLYGALFAIFISAVVSVSRVFR